MKTRTQLSNKILLSLLLSLLSLAMPAQKIDQLFIDMPDKYIPTLSKQQRFELLEYSRLNRKDSTKNRFGRNAAIETFDTINQLITINTTQTSRIEIKILNKQTIGLIQTINQPIALSKVILFDLNWHPLPTQPLFPATELWINKEKLNTNNTTMEEVLKLAENSFLSYSFTKSDNKIEVYNNTSNYLSIEDKNIFSPYLSKKLTKILQHTRWVVL